MTLMHIAVDLLTAFSATTSEGASSDTSVNLVSGGQEDVIFQGGFETPECVPIQLLVDPGFERSTGQGPHDNPFWIGASTNFGRPFCSSAYCDDADSGPHTGKFWVLFGGVPDYEISSLYQDVVMPVGQSRALNYWLWLGRSSRIVATHLYVLIDDYTLAHFYMNELDPWNYKQFSADVSDFADGNPHRIQFKYFGNGEFDYSTISLDDVTLDCAGAAR